MSGWQFWIDLARRHLHDIVARDRRRSPPQVLSGSGPRTATPRSPASAPASACRRAPIPPGTTRAVQMGSTTEPPTPAGAQGERVWLLLVNRGLADAAGDRQQAARASST
jgi:hypothetical protein